ncbi:6-phosphogluconate dehydrogenase C-terminal domain-like protein [Hypoxylon rubiginosum]|uniref:6-phosphogluconate dehydrogenase C-terminal domain-like protein n=1 Tax=Hypoxylon rubiginosum TaxID=110542 RepID=A0ACB9ZAW0_9PEZI|nr:6-phosphogluconate dehydrogenase C-terminal domain-like protein [Hypoxylon rubiginosum]
MTRALLFGAGSLGVPYSWVLCRAIGESNVTAVCRSNFDEASRNGFTIHSKLWGNDLKCKPRIAKTAAEAAQQIASDKQQPFFDFVVIAAKAIPTRPSTAELIGPAVTPGRTGIVLIQNGVGIEAEYAARYPDNPVLSAVAYFPAAQVAPGVVQHREVEMLHVGTYPAAAPAAHKEAARAFVELIGKGGASARLHDDVQRERWGKLLVNGSWNPVCALTRSRDREFIESKKAREEENGEGEDDALGFIRDVMLEIAAVARAHGYGDVDEGLVDFQIGRARARDLPGVQPSMLTDAFEGRSMEVDAIVGNAVRLAKEKGVPVPMLRTIYLLANGLSESFSRAKTLN